MTAMIWVSIGFNFIMGATALLRYLCLSQNNNYILSVNKPFMKFYIPIASFSIGIYIVACLSFLLNDSIIIGGMILSIFSFLFVFLKNIFFRIKFKFTSRGKIYFIFYEILYFLTYGFLLILLKNEYIILMSLLSIIMCFPLIIKVTELPINCYFVYKNKKYIINQKNKLNGLKCRIIGITGSYGKTSCKKILNFLLSDKFNIIASEGNHNTPMGIAIDVDKIKDDTDFFISEFGARQPGDIKELCDLFPPEIGIITGICAQHIETFGSTEEIIEEKSNLIKSVNDNHGKIFFNADDKNVYNLYSDYKGEKISAGTDDKFNVYASDINLSFFGSSFCLNYNGCKYPCGTKLLGRHNVQNIVLAASVAFELGIEGEEVVKKIELLPQIKHRLEYIYSNGVHILDDSYNANVNGVKSAIELLGLYEGRKIVVSQGIVELGRLSESQNVLIGEMLAEVFDVVVLYGINSKFIEKGLKIKGYNGLVKKAKKFNDVNKIIKEIVRSGDALLLQNDIPDYY